MYMQIDWEMQICANRPGNANQNFSGGHEGDNSVLPR